MIFREQFLFPSTSMLILNFIRRRHVAEWCGLKLSCALQIWTSVALKTCLCFKMSKMFLYCTFLYNLSYHLTMCCWAAILKLSKLSLLQGDYSRLLIERRYCHQIVHCITSDINLLCVIVCYFSCFIMDVTLLGFWWLKCLFNTNHAAFCFFEYVILSFVRRSVVLSHFACKRCRVTILIGS